MAVPHGKNSVFYLTDSGGTLQNIKAELDDLSKSASRETAETTAFGDNDKTYIAGLRDGTISISGHFDAASASTAYKVLESLFSDEAAKAFEYGPAGDTSGDVKISGDCLWTSFDVSSTVSDKVSISAEFQVTGGLTYGSFA